mmetsp:Transcript_24102/g.82229  ORF Transcript_24102/g.82229 Transcript_24102/m.82229 type:complete len:223 (-) Transcript_24102:227-895(-)
MGAAVGSNPGPDTLTNSGVTSSSSSDTFVTDDGSLKVTQTAEPPSAGSTSYGRPGFSSACTSACVRSSLLLNSSSSLTALDTSSSFPFVTRSIAAAAALWSPASAAATSSSRAPFACKNSARSSGLSTFESASSASFTFSSLLASPLCASSAPFSAAFSFPSGCSLSSFSMLRFRYPSATSWTLFWSPPASCSSSISSCGRPIGPFGFGSSSTPRAMRSKRP